MGILKKVKKKTKKAAKVVAKYTGAKIITKTVNSIDNKIVRKYVKVIGYFVIPTTTLELFKDDSSKHKARDPSLDMPLNTFWRTGTRLNPPFRDWAFSKTGVPLKVTEGAKVRLLHGIEPALRRVALYTFSSIGKAKNAGVLTSVMDGDNIIFCTSRYECVPGFRVVGVYIDSFHIPDVSETMYNEHNLPYAQFVSLPYSYIGDLKYGVSATDKITKIYIVGAVGRIPSGTAGLISVSEVDPKLAPYLVPEYKTIYKEDVLV